MCFPACWYKRSVSGLFRSPPVQILCQPEQGRNDIPGQQMGFLIIPRDMHMHGRMLDPPDQIILENIAAVGHQRAVVVDHDDLLSGEQVLDGKPSGGKQLPAEGTQHQGTDFYQMHAHVVGGDMGAGLDMKVPVRLAGADLQNGAGPWEKRRPASVRTRGRFRTNSVVPTSCSSFWMLSLRDCWETNSFHAAAEKLPARSISRKYSSAKKFIRVPLSSGS